MSFERAGSLDFGPARPLTSLGPTWPIEPNYLVLAQPKDTGRAMPYLSGSCPDPFDTSTTSTTTSFPSLALMNSSQCPLSFGARPTRRNSLYTKINAKSYIFRWVFHQFRPISVILSFPRFGRLTIEHDLPPPKFVIRGIPTIGSSPF